MRLLLLLLLVAAALSAEAQSVFQALEALPACGQKCLLPVLSSLPCNISTLPSLTTCLCPNVTALLTLTACVETNCNATEEIAVTAASASLCAGQPIPDRTGQLKAIAISCFLITALLVGLRFYARYSLARQLWHDDWMILVAISLLFALMVLEILMAHNGFGRHVWNINSEKLPLLLKYFYLTELIYIAIQILAKVSILLFYLRVFPHLWFRRSCHGLIAWEILHGMIFMLLIIFQCHPISITWDVRVIRSNHCLNTQIIYYLGGAFSIAEDLIILFMPIPLLSTLNLSKGKKISLMAMFGIGSFACITSIVRMKYLFSSTSLVDATWTNADVTIWSEIEIYVAVICTCLPFLRPLLERAFPKLFQTFNTRSRPHPTELGTVPQTRSQCQDKTGVGMSMGKARGMGLGTGKTMGVDRMEDKEISSTTHIVGGLGRGWEER